MKKKLFKNMSHIDYLRREQYRSAQRDWLKQNKMYKFNHHKHQLFIGELRVYKENPIRLSVHDVRGRKRIFIRYARYESKQNYNSLY